MLPCAHALPPSFQQLRCQLSAMLLRGRAQIVERETSREKNLEKAQKEAKVRARREAARAAESALPEAGGRAGDAAALLQARLPLIAHCTRCRMNMSVMARHNGA